MKKTVKPGLKILNHMFVIVMFTFILATLISACEQDTTGPVIEDPTVVKFNPDLIYGTVTDIDGNTYKTITIDSLTWMAENLRTTHYRDGSPITEVTDSLAWAALKTEASCSYNNSINPDTLNIYGRLYNFYSVADLRNIAPEGWHVADTSDWRILMDILVSQSIAGGKLKEAGTAHWTEFNTDATNETGFTALPAGYRQDINAKSKIGDSTYAFRAGSFYNLGNSANFWTGTTKNSTDAFGYNILKSGSGCYKIAYKKKLGFSIRCVKNR
jgi:uncharacterized protein (TIGR02145 family)